MINLIGLDMSFKNLYVLHTKNITHQELPDKYNYSFLF